MSYTQFSYQNLSIEHSILGTEQTQTVYVTVENTGNVAALETVQCYIRRKVATTTRPLRELKAFEKVHLAPGESRVVEFELTPKQLSYYGAEKCFKNDEGDIEVFVGSSSEAEYSIGFTVKD
ncbi:beta-glucosidase [Vibrio ishigakensis]|uniref:Beta-D-glucoside glucohydrolase n=1 Tax=Vibrio ishigakensis TaxID=1481914 RepID=A0A0B8PH33_9VIBR|nr:beta-glucosidase [Vibrio ishigakensis]